VVERLGGTDGGLLLVPNGIADKVNSGLYSSFLLLKGCNSVDTNRRIEMKAYYQRTAPREEL
jgi:hypothetical protein